MGIRDREKGNREQERKKNTEEEKKVGPPNEKQKFATAQKEQGVITCDICYEIVKSQGIIESCHHTFCFSCIKRWSETENSCPECKKRFNTIKRKEINNSLPVPKEKNKKSYTEENKDEIIEIPYTTQGDIVDPHNGTDVDEFLSFLLLARDMERFTQLGHFLSSVRGPEHEGPIVYVQLGEAPAPPLVAEPALPNSFSDEEDEESEGEENSSSLSFPSDTSSGKISNSSEDRSDLVSPKPQENKISFTS
eukprot:TRINITY_DN15923_c0_g1_i1.p1 TRINITY_DN15923_c0_g1~~TRINITY_DN15923_c0_g1_i1.p1  ORF type:complete len:260 (-),score=29.81 TRINITY_DN15923_c0_g1_i1:26-775(-)